MFMIRYVSIIGFSFFVLLSMSCKKQKIDTDVSQPISIDYSKPCELSSFFNNKETHRFTYVKDGEGKIIEEIHNEYTSVNNLIIKKIFQYNSNGQLIKKAYHVLPSNTDEGYETYEYDEQGRMIKKTTVSKSLEKVVTSWYYNKENKVEKIRYTNLTVISLKYNSDGDLVQADWCNSDESSCTTVLSFEYDKTKSYCKVPESFIAAPLIDIPLGNHFLKKINNYNSKGVITSSIVFEVEQALDGHPISVSTYPEGASEQKIMWFYKYECK